MFHCIIPKSNEIKEYEEKMEFYFAPMEGVTRHIYRNAYEEYFGKIDKYFAPFLCANQSGNYKTREITDILPENNEGIHLIPQILTNKARDFILAANKIKSLGYDEVNLNLGCPSGTVVSKGKGSGFLAHPEALDEFLEEIFEQVAMKISIKTRLGKEEPEEFYQLLEIYNKYPMEELIIHARVQKDFYKNKPNKDMFAEAVRTSKNPICYNGDIFTVDDYRVLVEQFPEVDKVMLGRGLIANPGLVCEILGQDNTDRIVLKRFHDKVYQDYIELFKGDKNALFKMKEIWYYMGNLFKECDKSLKRIKKAQKFSEYEDAVATLFREQ